MSMWKKSSVPGTAKSVYGAQYPPILTTGDTKAANRVKQTIVRTRRRSPIGSDISEEAKARYENFQETVEDAWDIESEGDLGDTAINAAVAQQAAEKVLAQHGGFSHQVSARARAVGMQRLAIQKEPLPEQLLPSSPNSDNQVYPKLPAISTRVPSPNKPAATKPVVTTDKITALLSTPTVDIERLRRECWKGIPPKLRPNCWRLLIGYVPLNSGRHAEVLKAKRDEYFNFIEQYYHTRNDAEHADMFRQIHIDIPRMCPLIPLFQQRVAQEVFERILYICAIRHPASEYVQGINDLVTPFFVVFLSQFISEQTDVGTFDLSSLPPEHLDIVEADSFWCVSRLIDTIQDNYTFAQPGVQRKVKQLEQLMQRVDSNLHLHIVNNQVEYLQFAFRWMNNLLMREIPLRSTIRLWDTYLCEPNGFASFHVYVCAAFLRVWSRQILSQRDFQNIMLFVQNLPTQSWNDQQVSELCADAYSIMCHFAGSKNHFS